MLEFLKWLFNPDTQIDADLAMALHSGIAPQPQAQPQLQARPQTPQSKLNPLASTPAYGRITQVRSTPAGSMSVKCEGGDRVVIGQGNRVTYGSEGALKALEDLHQI